LSGELYKRDEHIGCLESWTELTRVDCLELDRQHWKAPQEGHAGSVNKVGQIVWRAVQVTEVEQIERSRKLNKKHKRDRLECLDLDRQQ
jgi:hypothetical protein